MSPYELAALAAAACWALTTIITPAPAAHLGAFAFTRIRMLMVFCMLAVWVAISGGWQTIDQEMAEPIILSGITGIFLGDTALFATMIRMGPRRTSILFSTNAPMSVILGWIFLGEVLAVRQLAGVLTVFAGVLLAIAFGKRKSQLHQWESISGPVWIGVALGLFAGLMQAVGSLIARPVMETGVDPVAVSAMRVGIAVICFYMALFLLPGTAMRARNPLTPEVVMITALSGILAMAIGMTLILFALSGGKVGIVSTLSATTPALVLPLIWMRTREPPAIAAWIGALLVIIGSGLIFSV